MARVNDAYTRRDRAALEVLAERVAAGVPAGHVSVGDRLHHAARRTATLEAARAELLERREGLAASGAARLFAEARAAGENAFLADACAAAGEAALAARATALARLEAVVAAARRLGEVRAPARSLYVRAALAGPARPAGGRLAPAARSLAAALEAGAAAPSPWEPALVILAACLERAGRPPPSVATVAGLEERWEALRAGWPDAPDLAGALARLPRGAELGLRLCRDGVEGGLQLAGADLAAGVAAALASEPVREVARRVLAVLGPRERCGACRADVYALELIRVSGPDEVHGLACPRCARTLRSYWRYGEPEGLEALVPVAVSVGLLVEEFVRLGTGRLTFQLLPAERNRLTARALSRRLGELCLAPYGIELPRGALRVRAGREVLPAGARVPDGARLAFVVEKGAGGSARQLLELVRSRASARFRR
jgi:hypothetical protein